MATLRKETVVVRCAHERAHLIPARVEVTQVPEETKTQYSLDLTQEEVDVIRALTGRCNNIGRYGQASNAIFLSLNNASKTILSITETPFGRRCPTLELSDGRV